VGSIEAIKGVSLEDVRPIEMKDFETSIKNAKKSVSVDLLKRYKEWESAQAAVSA
jgi:SpoVK/Ycf46/Vps4 family AAA+-type ATPase